MAEPTVLAALLLDGVLGWPRAVYRIVGHPVGAFARLIGGCERCWNRPGLSFGARRALGVLTVLLLAGGAAILALALELAFHSFAGNAAWLLIAAAASPALAQRSLHGHYMPVLAALEEYDLLEARRRVAMIVGRDTGSLDEAGVARAAIESLAESFCDGIAAPLFWLIVLGLPGIWVYKAINTADSLIGHAEEPWRAFGWAAARSDDVLNLFPARIAGLLICLAGGRGWRVLRRDHDKHASPNAGWPEAAMAGALGVRLAGPVTYDGVLHDKPWIGDGANASLPAMRQAVSIFLRACGLLWLVAGAIAWLG